MCPQSLLRSLIFSYAAAHQVGIFNAYDQFILIKNLQPVAVQNPDVATVKRIGQDVWRQLQAAVDAIAQPPAIMVPGISLF